MAKQKEEKYHTLRRAVIHSVDVRSVIRVAAVCHLCLGLVWIMTMSALWFLFRSTGLWDKFNSLLADLAGIDPLNAGSYFLFVFSLAFLEFCVLTLLAGVSTVIFNILSHWVGGVRFILADSVIFSHEIGGEKAAAISDAARVVSVRKELRKEEKDTELVDTELVQGEVMPTQFPVVRETPRISITVDSAQGKTVSSSMKQSFEENSISVPVASSEIPSDNSVDSVGESVDTSGSVDTSNSDKANSNREEGSTFSDSLEDNSPREVPSAQGSRTDSSESNSHS